MRFFKILIRQPVVNVGEHMLGIEALLVESPGLWLNLATIAQRCAEERPIITTTLAGAEAASLAMKYEDRETVTRLQDLQAR